MRLFCTPDPDAETAFLSGGGRTDKRRILEIAPGRGEEGPALISDPSDLGGDRDPDQ